MKKHMSTLLNEYGLGTETGYIHGENIENKMDSENLMRIVRSCFVGPKKDDVELLKIILMKDLASKQVMTIQDPEKWLYEMRINPETIGFDPELLKGVSIEYDWREKKITAIPTVVYSYYKQSDKNQNQIEALFLQSYEQNTELFAGYDTRSIDRLVGSMIERAIDQIPSYKSEEFVEKMVEAFFNWITAYIVSNKQLV